MSDKRKPNGQFDKGNKGRVKGSTSKRTNEIREAFSNLVTNNIEQLQEDIDSLKSKDRLEMIMKLSEYLLPKLKASEVSATTNETKTIRPVITWDDEPEDVEPPIKWLDDED